MKLNQFYPKMIFQNVWNNKGIKNIKNGKAQGLDEIPVEIWKIQKFQNLLLNYCNKVLLKKIYKYGVNGAKGDPSNTNNYHGITFICISAKARNLMLLIRIRPY